jgi:uncharacterized protein YjgD (DUF1641 family)
MAQPIPRAVKPRDPRTELRSRLDDAPVEHAEALLAAYEVLQGLHDRGVLELMRGALGSGEQVLEIAVNTARSPQSIRSLRNLLLLTNMIGQIDPVQLGNVTHAVPKALNAVGDAKPPSIWQFISALWDKNVRSGLWVSIGMLRAIGEFVNKPP